MFFFLARVQVSARLLDRMMGQQPRYADQDEWPSNHLDVVTKIVSACGRWNLLSHILLGRLLGSVPRTSALACPKPRVAYLNN